MESGGATVSLADWPRHLRGVSDGVSQAFVDYEAALLQAPDLAETRIRLARLRLSRGDWDAAAVETWRDDLGKTRLLAITARLVDSRQSMVGVQVRVGVKVGVQVGDS